VVEVEILITPRPELVSNLKSLVMQPVQAGAQTPPCLILLDFDFTHQAADLADLQALASMAEELQAPIVAGASSGFFGLRHFAHVASFPDPIAVLQDAAHTAWREFQRSNAARWISLTLGRYLQRAPHDDPKLPYREKTEEARPESFLWGRGIWLIAAAAARSVRTHGHLLDLAGRGGMFTDMPTRAYPKSTNEAIAFAAEAPLPEMRLSELAWAGFTPVAGVLRASTVLLPMVVTCFRLTPGRLTVEGTLAYQLLAAQLAFGLEAALNQGALQEQTAEAMIRSALLETLGPLAGETPDDAVKVEVTAPGPEPGSRPMARVEVHPGIVLEGKKPEFFFEVPLRVV